MKILKGKIKIGKYKNIDVFVDWSYLTRDRGLRKEKEAFQYILGNFLFLISIIGIIFSIVWGFSLGYFLPVELVANTQDYFVGLFWVSSSILVYSSYLRRDRNKFFDTLDFRALHKFRKDLEKMKKIKSVEILDYVDYDVLYVLDDIIASPNENIYADLMAKLISLKDIQVLIDRLGINRQDLLEAIKKESISSSGDKTEQINKLLYQSFVLADKYGFSYIGEWVVFLKLSLDEYKKLFRGFEISENTLKALLEWSKTQAIINKYKKLWSFRASLKPTGIVNRAYTSSYTPTLNKYAIDLTAQVVKEGFQYALGRENEINDVLKNLQQDMGGAVLIIGEAGIGKTMILKSIATRMVVEDVPNILKDKRLVEFNFQRAISASSNTNKLRRIIENVFEEVKHAKNIILVLDDLEELVNLRSEVAHEIVSTLAKSLERSKLKLVATTTKIGYSRYIKPQSAISNLFDNIWLQEPTPEIAMQILLDEQSKFEKKYGLKIQFNAIKQAIDLSVKYDFSRLLPLKALDLLEDACVSALDKGLEFVSAREVEEMVSKEIGIKIGRLLDEEKKKLLNLEGEMHKRVIGQNKAIEAVASALRRARAGLAGKNRPIASFLFFGPTGVGKTEVAKTLAHVYFGDEKLLTRLDMSEFQEDENIKRLIGYMQKDGFVEGVLTGKVRQKPFSLILLDEIEKANPKVLDLFLQVLDEGFITDGIGRKVSFKSTIIIATSNIGSKEIAKAIESGLSYEETNKLALKKLKEVLRIEFINRFDKVIMFKPLSQVEVERIAGLMLDKLKNKLLDEGIEMQYEDQLLFDLVKYGYSKTFGAREMRRAIQDMIENKIAELIISGKLKSGGRLNIKSIRKFEIN